jgi:hypothetical protein
VHRARYKLIETKDMKFKQATVLQTKR